MNSFLKSFLALILILSIYHLIRDILQILDIEYSFVNIFHRDHIWCKPYCDYVTLPLDFFGIIASFVLLKRNKLGLLGILLILTLPLWLLALYLP